MTSEHEPLAAAPSHGADTATSERPGVVRAALRATSIGAGVALALLLVVTAVSIVPRPLHVSCALGLAVAVVSTALGNLLIASAALAPGAASAWAMARAVLVDFALQVLLGGGVSAALFLLGTKFLAPAAFALAFAASAIVMRITGAGILSRALMSAVARRETRRRT